VSAFGSSTVTITTGGPLPIGTFGRFGAVVSLVLPPPNRPNSQNTERNPSMPSTTKRSLSLRNRFFSAGGIRKPLCCCRAAYGGGRDVFRGGMAKCIVCVWGEVCGQGEASCEARIGRARNEGGRLVAGGVCAADYRCIVRSAMRMRTARKGEGEGGRRWGGWAARKGTKLQSTRD
jgi:hypothetical protein